MFSYIKINWTIYYSFTVIFPVVAPVCRALQPSSYQRAATHLVRGITWFLLSARGECLDSHLPLQYVSTCSEGVEIMVRFIYQIPALKKTFLLLLLGNGTPPLPSKRMSKFQFNGKKNPRSSAQLFNVICCKAQLIVICSVSPVWFKAALLSINLYTDPYISAVWTKSFLIFKYNRNRYSLCNPLKWVHDF